MKKTSLESQTCGRSGEGGKGVILETAGYCPKQPCCDADPPVVLGRLRGRWGRAAAMDPAQGMQVGALLGD